jgi:hypothetical protein
MQFPSAMGFPNPLPQFTVETPNRTKQKQENPKKKKKIEWYNDGGDRASLAD